MAVERACWIIPDALDGVEVADFARKIEELGYSRLWVAETLGRDPSTAANTRVPPTRLANAATSAPLNASGAVQHQRSTVTCDPFGPACANRIGSVALPPGNQPTPRIDALTRLRSRPTPSAGTSVRQSRISTFTPSSENVSDTPVTGESPQRTDNEEATRTTSASSGVVGSLTR